jgi:hypothetical protein
MTTHLRISWRVYIVNLFAIPIPTTNRVGLRSCFPAMLHGSSLTDVYFNIVALL